MFSDLKAHKFEMSAREEEDKEEKGSALVANQPSSTSNKSLESLNSDFLTDEKFALFV